MTPKNTKVVNSLFIEIIGDCIRNRILEFFIEGREFDYPIKYLAEELNLNRNTLYKGIDQLTSANLIVFSRRIGSSKFYKINSSNSIVLDLVKLFDKLINIEISKHLETHDNLCDYGKDGLRLISKTEFYSTNYVQPTSVPTTAKIKAEKFLVA